MERAAVEESIDNQTERPASRALFDADSLKQLTRSQAFVPGLLVIAGLGLLFWDLLNGLVSLWMSDEYYSHGFIVPLLSAYVVHAHWPRLRNIAVRPGWIAGLAMVALGYLAYVTTHTDITAILALTFLFTLLAGIWFVAGWRWMLALCLPILYLGFALPLWTGAIEFYTNPAQLASTTVAHKLLQVLGFSPIRMPSEPTSIYLTNFTLNIAVPCSGLKLILAVSAFTAFFMMIANLKWWGNLAMAAIVLPLCVLINGLRIALIGIVGDTNGAEAGLKFHDYSGYITLLICFFLLFKIARGLGWKD